MRRPDEGWAAALGQNSEGIGVGVGAALGQRLLRLVGFRLPRFWAAALVCLFFTQVPGLAEANNASEARAITVSATESATTLEVLLSNGVPVEILETLANWSSTNAKRVSSREKGDLIMLGIGGFTPGHVALSGTRAAAESLPSSPDPAGRHGIPRACERFWLLAGPRCRSTSRTRAGAGGSGSGPPRSCACSRSRSRSDPA